MGEWQPISTVPFGVPVLIWVPGINRGRDSAEVVVVLQPLGGPLVRTSNRGVVYRSNGGPDDGDAHMLDWDFAPTHWMALPPPPKQ